MDDWNGAADPPFVYGTVGHDPDTGGVDSNSNTCCQCYQLIFESPQSGVSGAVPIPKPMIVQTFNTAAGGGKNFDIYMAAGGLGNFNGCTGGASAMYDQFPDLGGNYSGGVRADPLQPVLGDEHVHRGVDRRAHVPGLRRFPVRHDQGQRLADESEHEPDVVPRIERPAEPLPHQLERSGQAGRVPEPT